MSNYPNWTVEELNILKEVYPKLGKCIDLQEFFPNRSLSSICLKAQRMGYRVIKNSKKGRTNSEYIELLKNTSFEALEEYKGSTVPILHKCKNCTHEWNTRPQHVLKPKAKCPQCDLESRRVSIDKVINTLSNVNLELLSPYTGSLNSIKVKHNTCGNIWDTKYSYIQQGSGCPKCNKGFGYSENSYPDKAAIYLLHIKSKNNNFYKVGVTTQPINRRINSLKKNIKEIFFIDLIYSIEGTGKNILIIENNILKKYIKYIYNGDSFPGYTELLDISNNVEEIKKDMQNENF